MSPKTEQEKREKKSKSISFVKRDNDVIVMFYVYKATLEAAPSANVVTFQTQEPKLSPRP